MFEGGLSLHGKRKVDNSWKSMMDEDNLIQGGDRWSVI